MSVDNTFTKRLNDVFSIAGAPHVQQTSVYVEIRLLQKGVCAHKAEYLRVRDLYAGSLNITLSALSFMSCVFISNLIVYGSNEL